MSIFRALHLLSPATKGLLHRIGQMVGLEIRLTGLGARNDLRLAHFLTLHDISLVIDVGANQGQFSELLFNAGYKGEIISFEALPDAHIKLKQRAENSRQVWSVAPRVALSDKKDIAIFHVTDADTSSSLLAPTENFVAGTPRVRVAKEIEVPTERLDAFADLLAIGSRRAFLKLDVQGAESMVLAGAERVLPDIQGMIIEMSLAELYRGQDLAFDMHRLVSAKGFELWDIWEAYRDPRNFRLNQIDAVYFRK